MARELDSAGNTVSGLNLEAIGEDGHAVANLLWKISAHLKQRRAVLPEQELTVVVALDYSDFKRWCQATNHNPRDRELVYARDVAALDGLQGPLTIVTTELGGRRLDAVDIQHRLFIINRMSGRRP